MNEKVIKSEASNGRYGVNSYDFDFTKKWWRIRDSNPGPADYDSVALTN